MINRKDHRKKNNEFYEAWRKIRWDPEITPFVFLLLCELADCQGSDSNTFVGNDVLAERLHFSPRWIQIGIRTLEEKKIIKVWFERGCTKRYISLRGELQFTPNKEGRTTVRQGVNHSSVRGEPQFTIPVPTTGTQYRKKNFLKENSDERPTNKNDENEGRTPDQEADLRHEEWLAMMNKKTRVQ